MLIQLRTSSGTQKLNIDDNSSIEAFLIKVVELTGIPIPSQKFKFGFPPTLLEFPSESYSNPINTVLKSGACLIINACPPSSSSRQQPPSQPTQSNNSLTPQPNNNPSITTPMMMDHNDNRDDDDDDALLAQAIAASLAQVHPPSKDSPEAGHSTIPIPLTPIAAPLSQTQLPPQPPLNHPEESLASHGHFVRRTVPDDNSCLFRAIAYLLRPSHPQYAHNPMALRQIIAEKVNQNKERFSEAILGKPNHEYQAWICKQNTWGGAIEISILANHFGIEFAAFDVKTMRLDRYQENEEDLAVGIVTPFQTRSFLIYDGIHYDALVLSLGDNLNDESMDLTQFPRTDEFAVSKAVQLVQGLHDSRKFTDTAGFLLKCGRCGSKFRGEKQAIEHAKATGHTDFTEN